MCWKINDHLINDVYLNVVDYHSALISCNKVLESRIPKNCIANPISRRQKSLIQRPAKPHRGPPSQDFYGPQKYIIKLE